MRRQAVGALEAEVADLAVLDVDIRGVSPASVSRPRLGREAMTWARSMIPGMVRPARLSSSLQARTPLIARRSIFKIAPGL